MRKYLWGIFALALVTTVVFAFAIPNRNVTPPIQEEVKEKPFATGAFLYIAGHVDSASSYGTAQIAPTVVCATPGSRRCAATFDLDGNGNRMGNPKTPIWTKP